MNSFYEEDLAYVHHVGYGEFSRCAGAELLKHFREAGLLSGRIIDLGCGSGHWAQRLTQEGYAVFGVDVSEKMIDLARKTAPEAEFLTSSLYQVALPPCRAVTALGEVLNYRAGDEPSPALLERLFQKIAAALQEGGIFAFDVIVRSEHEVMAYRSWSKGPDWAVLIDVSERRLESDMVRDITVFRKVGDGYRRSEERHRVHVWDDVEIVRLLKKSGFKVTVSPRYGTYPLAQRRLAFIAKK